MSTVVILQSNYIPWRGYFDLIRHADDFVFYDDVQFTKNDWRNRNRIVGPQGPQWLTIPVETSGRFGQTIAEAQPSDRRWSRKHLMAIQSALARGPEFAGLAQCVCRWIEAAAEETSLSRINQIFIRGIMAELGLTARLHQAADLASQGSQTGRLVSICRSLGATRYLSGPAAKSYLDEAQFGAAGIAVAWMAYPAYPSYRQSDGGYDPWVSILDAMAWLPRDKVLGDRTE
jgi:hypothetical protein